MSTLIETIEKVLLYNREISIRNDIDRGELIVSVVGYNKTQNIKMIHSYKIEDRRIDESNLAHVIHLLNESIQ